jgi:hypothetical protein
MRPRYPPSEVRQTGRFANSDRPGARWNLEISNYSRCRKESHRNDVFHLLPDNEQMGRSGKEFIHKVDFPQQSVDPRNNFIGWCTHNRKQRLVEIEMSLARRSRLAMRRDTSQSEHRAWSVREKSTICSNTTLCLAVKPHLSAYFYYNFHWRLGRSSWLCSLDQGHACGFVARSRSMEDEFNRTKDAFPRLDYLYLYM